MSKTKLESIVMKDSYKYAVTHGGVGHADDMMAAAIILTFEIIRSPSCIYRRNPTEAELASPDVLVFDTGGQFDPEIGNFDHHQQGFAEARTTGNCTPYSSVGLIWRELEQLLHTHSDHESRLAALAYVDVQLIEHIDAHDNGTLKVDGSQPIMTVAQMLSGFNPNDLDATSDDFDTDWGTAVKVAEALLMNTLERGTAIHAAKQDVLSAPVVGQTLVLEKYVPYQGVLSEHPEYSDLLYVTHPSQRGGWVVTTISSAPFVNKKSFPESWAALTDEALEEASGIKGVTFCHRGLFMVATVDKESALAVAAVAEKA
jgi:uncharacterized UPF0160 family protein